MTIGIGLICRDTIILASDSKTEDEGGLKKTDLHKITLSWPAAPLSWGIVQAGKTDFATRCVELIQARVKELVPVTTEAFRNICEEAAKRVRQHANEVFGNSAQATVDSRFWLILGVAEHGKKVPRLFILKSDSCFASEVRDRACIGNAANLAEYILEGIKIRQTPVQQAECAAIYTAMAVATKDAATEGPIVVMTVAPDGCGILDQSTVDKFAEDCGKFEEQRQLKWSGELLDWIIEQDKQRILRMFNP